MGLPDQGSGIHDVTLPPRLGWLVTPDARLRKAMAYWQARPTARLVSIWSMSVIVLSR